MTEEASRTLLLALLDRIEVLLDEVRDTVTGEEKEEDG